MITKKEFNEMSFDEAWEYCCSESDYFKDRDSLLEVANYGSGINILQALYDYPYTNYWFCIDEEYVCPVPIDCKDDLRFYLNNLAILGEVSLDGKDI